MPPIPPGTRCARLAIDELEQCIQHISASDVRRLETLVDQMKERHAALMAQAVRSWVMLVEDDA